MHRKNILARKSSTSTKKLSSKKMKMTGRKKVSSILKELIEELLTDNPDGGRSLEEKMKAQVTFYNSLKGLIMLKLKTKKHHEVSFSVILILGKLYLSDTRN